MAGHGRESASLARSTESRGAQQQQAESFGTGVRSGAASSQPRHHADPGGMPTISACPSRHINASTNWADLVRIGQLSISPRPVGRFENTPVIPCASVRSDMPAADYRTQRTAGGSRLVIARALPIGAWLTENAGLTFVPLRPP